MPLKSFDLTPNIGSEIKVDMAALLSGAHSDDLRRVLVERGAIVIRDMELSDEQLRTLAATLGHVRIGSAKRGADGKTLTEGDGGVLKVTLDEKQNPDYAKFLFGNHVWHMDGTYEEIPPFATMLVPRVLSKLGGDTEFANTYAAYDDLPESDKEELEKLKVVHMMQAALFPAKPNCTPEEFAVWCSYPVRSHPLVWRHKSGRKSLVLSTSGGYVEGMHPAESHDLLQRLMIHATQPRYVYRHKWRMGDLAMWDNTGTMHRVLPYDAASGRLLHRITLKGEELIS
jgi:alpha-ketoglutarate-dependent taurine dioxygenase